MANVYERQQQLLKACEGETDGVRLPAIMEEVLRRTGDTWLIRQYLPLGTVEASRIEHLEKFANIAFGTARSKFPEKTVMRIVELGECDLKEEVRLLWHTV